MNRKKLRVLRIGLGMNQDTFADRIFCSQTNISNIELGKSTNIQKFKEYEDALYKELVSRSFEEKISILGFLEQNDGDEFFPAKYA